MIMNNCLWMGILQPIKRNLPIATDTRGGFKRFFLTEQNIKEAAIIHDLRSMEYGISNKS
ncbi:MAG: hypothetical protein ABI045_03705 [Flavobacteriales bacterium]